MSVAQNNITIVISMAVAILSTIFGQFWFLFAFLLILNVLDYITGIIKAKYLKIESSLEALKGFSRTVYTWILIGISFGLSYMFVKLGESFDRNLDFMMVLGWFILAHCIVNEIRSILENLVQMDKSNYIPDWLIRGLQVTQALIDKKANDIVDKIEHDFNLNSLKEEKGPEVQDEDRETIGTQE